ncbi:FadR/GntR family transcriptional regulator [Leucobacter albus]|uniref:FadR/GntR family transcriptional regulator n=1 Tax=Leucobacter albus TaxID=272210 RepID=A0ABW3TRX6_9MICO
MAVTDDVILRIKDMIRTGELSPGDRLPPEKELGELLGASRNSLREAVKALEVIRVLDVRRGDGTYVTSLEPHLLLEVLSFAADLHSDDSVLEMFEVRRMLEPQAAARAARSMTAEAVAALEREVSSVTEHTDNDALVQHDSEFHRAIVAELGNGYLSGLVESLAAHTVRARVWRALTQDGAKDRTISEHRAIAKAIASGDAELAAALMTTHIAGVESWLREATSVANPVAGPAVSE